MLFLSTDEPWGGVLDRFAISVKTHLGNPIHAILSQGFGFENKGTEALSFRQVYGCFFQAPDKSTH